MYKGVSDWTTITCAGVFLYFALILFITGSCRTLSIGASPLHNNKCRNVYLAVFHQTTRILYCQPGYTWKHWSELKVVSWIKHPHTRQKIMMMTMTMMIIITTTTMMMICPSSWIFTNDTNHEKLKNYKRSEKKSGKRKKESVVLSNEQLTYHCSPLSNRSIKSQERDKSS